MACGAARASLRRRIKEQLLARIFRSGEVREILIVVRVLASRIIFRIKGLDAADKLRQRALDARR